jgi:hypothetical protein
MKVSKPAIAIVAVVLTQAWALPASENDIGAGVVVPTLHLPGEPRQCCHQPVTGVIEGWYPNQDGTHTFLIGYFNYNKVATTDIPIGPDNNIQPGGPDMGQPTHFLPGRGWGVFTITVPKDFGDKTLTWTLRTEGQTTTLPLRLIHAVYQVNPFSEVGMGNTPPVLSWDEGGPKNQGPGQFSMHQTAKVGIPLILDAYVADDAKTFPGALPPKTPAVTVTWERYRGPAEVKFANAKPAVQPIARLETTGHPFAGKATTEATFTQPGEYTLYLAVNDWSGVGGRGFVCCWTNGFVHVTVTP